jgi:alkylation response protein AidB-like acyl-CoA dehydrogenase
VDFTLDETQREIAALAAAVLDKEPGDQVWRALAEAGLLALALPSELDGDGLGIAEVALVLTEIGRAAAEVPALSLALGLLPLRELGTPRQRAELLPEIAAGSAVVTAAVHEPSAPMPARPATTAVAENGSWALSGVKTTVPYAAEATRILVPASLPGGTGVFVVDPHADGVTVTGSAVRLENVIATDADLLRDREPGQAIATLHRYALAGAAALADGALAGALALTTEHIGRREQFGKPLATFQAVALQIADVYIASRTLHLAALSAVWRMAAGLDAQADLDIAAYWLAGQAPEAIAVCHHLHGGLGVDITYPLHRYYTLLTELSRFVAGAEERLGELVS